MAQHAATAMAHAGRWGAAWAPRRAGANAKTGLLRGHLARTHTNTKRRPGAEARGHTDTEHKRRQAHVTREHVRTPEGVSASGWPGRQGRCLHSEQRARA
jgi:hypothetical protein